MYQQRDLAGTAAADELVIRGEQTASADSSEGEPIKEKIKMHKLRTSITLRKEQFHVQSISTGAATPNRGARRSAFYLPVWTVKT